MVSGVTALQRPPELDQGEVESDGDGRDIVRFDLAGKPRLG